MWRIDYVTDSCKCDCCEGKNQRQAFHEYMCDAHTHGLDEFGSKELQIVLDTDPELIAYIFNSVGEMVHDGLKLSNGMLIGGLFEGYAKLKVFETTDSKGEPIFRLVIPDSSFKFPEESKEYPYNMQYESPYLSSKENIS